jgi:hypothetical protein
MQAFAATVSPNKNMAHGILHV